MAKESTKKKKKNTEYNEDSIKTLSYTEGIRRRPTMYIGHTGVKGVYHLVAEGVDNIVDEFSAGHGDLAYVSYDIKTKEFTLRDGGRGIPVGKLEDIMCKTHTGGKLETNTNYKFSRGMNGVGLKCINALSEYCEVYVERDGKEYHQSFAKGKVVSELETIGKSKYTGTTIVFKPDISVMKDIDIDPKELMIMLEASSYLNKGLTFEVEILDGDKTVKHEKYCSKNGIQDFIKKISKSPVFKDVYFESKSEKMEVEVVLNFEAKSDEENIVSFVNGAKTSEHGTHVTGLRLGLTKVILDYIDKNKLIGKKDGNIKVTGEDIREGLVAIVNAKYEEPEFEGQTKNKLSSSDMQGFVQKATSEYLITYFNKNSKIAKSICEKAIVNAKGRMAAKRSKERVKKENSSIFSSLSSIAKYSRCEETDPTKKEIYICEGKSGGGSVNEARDVQFQSKYALRGKPLNSYETNIFKVLENKEFNDLITILGLKVDGKGNVDISGLRYHKIVIIADADADGEVCA